MGTPERAYRTTHPWISFRADLSRASAEFWMLLGEARSKVDHLSLALLKPAVAEEMHRVYLAKGAQATTAIEGNTLSEEEVEAIVGGRAGAPQPSQEYLYREVENIVSANAPTAQTSSRRTTSGRSRTRSSRQPWPTSTSPGSTPSMTATAARPGSSSCRSCLPQVCRCPPRTSPASTTTPREPSTTATSIR